MQFTKIHGLGNDFIAIDMRGRECPDFNALAPKWCDRHIGIGADGFAIVLPSDKADIRMRIIDADGTEAEMCGNGIRAFTKFVYDTGIINKTEFTVETLGGIMRPVITKLEDGKVKLVRVDMGMPEFDPKKVPVVGTEQVIERPVRVQVLRQFRLIGLVIGIGDSGISFRQRRRFALFIQVGFFPDQIVLDFPADAYGFSAVRNHISVRPVACYGDLAVFPVFVGFPGISARCRNSYNMTQQRLKR